MGNQSDLQKQVKRFKTRAHSAETQLATVRDHNEVLKEMLNESVLSRDALQQELQRVRTILTAVLGETGGIMVLQETLELIDDGHLIGIRPPVQDEDGNLVLEPLWAEDLDQETGEL